MAVRIRCADELSVDAGPAPAAGRLPVGLASDGLISRRVNASVAHASGSSIGSSVVPLARVGSEVGRRLRVTTETVERAGLPAVAKPVRTGEVDRWRFGPDVRESDGDDTLDDVEPLACAVPVLSAKATATVGPMTAPTPSATASAPIRPTYAE